MKVREMPIGEVKPYPNNPRINDQAVQGVADSIQAFGWQQPIVVDKDNVIIVGHTRLKAAKLLGLEKVPVVVADNLTPDEVAAYRLADNKSGEVAIWDDVRLAEELRGIELDMSPWFDKQDLSGALDQMLEQFEEPEMPEEVETRVKDGQVWQLGDHTLVCGDSTDPASYGAFQGEADLVVTDPPYNVSYEGGTGLTIENDSFRTDAEYQLFLTDAFKPMAEHLKQGGAFYVWHATRHERENEAAILAAGLEPKQTLVWNKSTFTIGRQDYQWKHEPCTYGWKPGAAHYFTPSRTLATVWDEGDLDPDKASKEELVRFAKAVLEAFEPDVLDERKPTKSADHPTMKPVPLIGRCIVNSSLRGETVLDPFGGSGSTLLACEQAGRNCVTIELDPHYCDVIIQRWEDMTGKEAVLR